jgi:hypothetical protein
MKNTYIPVEVMQEGKRSRWQIDVTNLGLEELISLKNELNGVSVSCLDAIIYDRTCSSAFMHQIRKERKQTGKRKIQKKIRRR